MSKIVYEVRNTLVWERIVEYLDKKLDYIHNKLESCGPDDVRFYQGQATLIRQLIALPDEIKTEDMQSNE